MHSQSLFFGGTTTHFVAIHCRCFILHFTTTSFFPSTMCLGPAFTFIYTPSPKGDAHSRHPRSSHQSEKTLISHAALYSADATHPNAPSSLRIKANKPILVAQTQTRGTSTSTNGSTLDNNQHGLSELYQQDLYVTVIVHHLR